MVVSTAVISTPVNHHDHAQARMRRRPGPPASGLRAGLLCLTMGCS